MTKSFACEAHGVKFKGAGGLASHLNSPRLHPELSTRKKRKKPGPQPKGMKNATKTPVVAKQELTKKDLIAIIQVRIEALQYVKHMLEAM